MLLQKSPNRWSCLPTALAMVVGKPFDLIIQLCKHDGSEILWPELPEPLKRKAFHIENMQYIAGLFSKALVPYVQEFGYCPVEPKTYIDYYPCHHLLERKLSQFNGIILGNYVGSVNRHAVAWNAIERMIYDPAGRLSQLDEFRVEVFYAAISI